MKVNAAIVNEKRIEILMSERATGFKTYNERQKKKKKRKS